MTTQSPAQFVVGGVETKDGTILDPDVLITDDTQLFIAPQPYFPYVRDYAGTVPDEDFTSATGLTTRKRRGMHGGYPTRILTDVGSYAALQITADLTLRACWRMLTSTTGSLNIVDYGDGGSLEAENSLWNYNISSARLPEFVCEDGGGVNHEARWVLPGNMPVDQEFCVEFQRNASQQVKCWVNGERLLQIDSVTGATDDGNGVGGGFAASGGGSSLLGALGIGADVDVDLYHTMVENVEAGANAASSYANNTVTWTSSELNTWIDRDDHVTVGGQTNCQLCLEPVSGNIDDQAGSLDSATDWSISDVTQQFFEGREYWSAVGDWESSHISELVNYSDATVRCMGMFDSATTTLGEGVAGFARFGSDDEDRNTLWQFRFNTSSQITLFWEHGSGATNETAVWDLPAAVRAGDLFEFQFTRTDNGDNTGDLRLYFRTYPDDDSGWTLLTVNSTSSGTNNSDHVGGATNPTGGTTANVLLNRGAAGQYIRQLAVFDTVIDPTA